MPWRRDRLPTPVFLPGEFHGRRSLAGYSPRVAKSRTRLSDWHFDFTLSKLWVIQCLLSSSAFDSISVFILFSTHSCNSHSHHWTSACHRTKCYSEFFIRVTPREGLLSPFNTRGIWRSDELESWTKPVPLIAGRGQMWALPVWCQGPCASRLPSCRCFVPWLLHSAVVPFSQHRCRCTFSGSMIFHCTVLAGYSNYFPKC